MKSLLEGLKQYITLINDNLNDYNYNTVGSEAFRRVTPNVNMS